MRNCYRRYCSQNPGSLCPQISLSRSRRLRIVAAPSAPGGLAGRLGLRKFQPGLNTTPSKCRPASSLVRINTRSADTTEFGAARHTLDERRHAVARLGSRMHPVDNLRRVHRLAGGVCTPCSGAACTQCTRPCRTFLNEHGGTDLQDGPASGLSLPALKISVCARATWLQSSNNQIII